MRASGTDQWQDGYPNAGTAAEDIERHIAWVAELEGRVVATAAVYAGHEPTYDAIYDGRWRTDCAEYGIIHRIAVDPAAKRRGVGSLVMDLCAQLARKSGLPSARCDTHEGNLAMRRALERNGYVYRGRIRLASGAWRVAYERIL